MNLEILLSLCGTLCLLSVSLCNKKKEELTQRYTEVSQSYTESRTISDCQGNGHPYHYNQGSHQPFPI